MACMALPLLLLLCLHGDAQEKEECSMGLNVRRDIMRTASVMDTLTINCIVVHCGMRTNVNWCKIVAHSYDCLHVNDSEHFQTQREVKDTAKDIYFLKIVNITMNDTGLYRCKMSGNMSSISHSINVTVIASKDTGNSQTNETRKTTAAPPHVPERDGSTSLNWPLYISISAGAVVLMVIVLVTVCMLKSKESKQPMVSKRTQDQEQRDPQSLLPLNKGGPPQPPLPASPCPSLPSRPRSIRSPHVQRPPSIRSHCVPGPAPVPARRSSRTKRTTATEAPPPNSCGMARPVVADGGCVYDNDGDEAETPIVYAALNHQVARKGPSHGHTYIAMEDLTEYAAIRVS